MIIMNITTEPIRDKRKLQILLSYLKNQSERNYMMAITQLNTALRASDIVDLKVKSFIQRNGKFRNYIVIKEKKTKKDQHVAINSALKKELTNYIQNNGFTYDDYLFPGKSGQSQPLSLTQLHRIYQKAAKDLNLECFNSHSLRKTWGFSAYDKTKDIALVMQVYGHTSVTHTFRYIGLEQKQKDKLYNKIQFTID